MSRRAAAAELVLDDFICFAVYSLGHAFNRLYQPLLKRLGLTYPQYVTMVVLWERDGRTVSELGGRLHLDSGTLTPLLKRLEAAGLIARTRDPEDERQVRIHLTKAGAALKEKARSLPREVGCATGHSAAELGRLKQELLRLRNHLDQPQAQA